MLADPSAAWLAVDCEQCGAGFGEPCRDLGCGDAGCDSQICRKKREMLKLGQAYHAGGNRERAELGLG